MGFLKSISKAVSKAVPKIKIGDPTKLITKPIEGIYNAAGTVAGSAVGNTFGVASQIMGGAGQVLSDPNAGAVLGGIGAAFGMPSLGGLGGLMGGGASAQPQSVAPIIMSAPSAPSAPAKDSTNILIMAGGGLVALLLVLFFTMKKR